MNYTISYVAPLCMITMSYCMENQPKSELSVSQLFEQAEELCIFIEKMQKDILVIGFSKLSSRSTDIEETIKAQEQLVSLKTNSHALNTMKQNIKKASQQAKTLPIKKSFKVLEEKIKEIEIKNGIIFIEDIV